MALPHLAARLFNTPLLIAKPKLDIILSAIGHRFGLSELPDIGAFAQDFDRRPTMGDGSNNLPRGLAIIPVHGTLTNRALGLDALSGMWSYPEIEQMFMAAMNDDRVTEVVLDISSPGGEVGAFDLADRIYQSRGVKPITAIANDMALSAAYAIASAADRIILPRSGDVGSIGVIATHVDQSGADEQRGLRYEHIYAGARKADFNPHQPLSEEARAMLQAEIDRTYTLFVDTVARNRGISTQVVRDTQARIYVGGAAVTVGLADEVASPTVALDQIINRVTRSTTMTTQAQAQPQPAPEVETPTIEPVAAPPATPPVAAEPPPNVAAQVAKLCADSGHPALAARLIADGATLEQASARIAQAKAITDICAAANRVADAQFFIEHNAAPEVVRKALTDAAAAADVPINGGLHPETGITSVQGSWARAFKSIAH